MEERISRMETEENSSGKKNMVREIAGMVIYIAVLAAAVFLINTFVFQRTVVDGMSMYPTLEDGDNLIADKISYRFTDPKRFDIIVFPYKQEEHTYFIKRIIGLPGETIQIEDGTIYIDGQELDEDYGRETILDAGDAGEPITLGEDEYFVMGDNRNNSEDSRHNGMGLVDSDRIVGKLWFTISPWKKIGFV